VIPFNSINEYEQYIDHLRQLARERKYGSTKPLGFTLDAYRPYDWLRKIVGTL